jgi:hypothetical protein
VDFFIGEISSKSKIKKLKIKQFWSFPIARSEGNKKESPDF